MSKLPAPLRSRLVYGRGGGEPFDCAAADVNDNQILRPEGTQDDTCGVTLLALRFV